MEPAFLRGQGAWGRLASLLFPASCVACGSQVSGAGLGALCESCWKSAAWAGGAKGQRKGEAWQFDECSAFGSFEGPFREAIHAYKFGGKTVFRRPFIDLLTSLPGEADSLCWVPTASASLKERGFDSTAELARGLARRMKIPLYGGLRRIRQGEKQAGLGREERWLNARGAFEAPEKSLAGQRLLLVDDVVTTGATLSECAAALKRAGASSVHAIALASGELRGN